MSSRCECKWLPWIPKCYGHCKKAKPVQQQQAQLFKLFATKDQTTGDAKIGPEAADELIAKDAEEIGESRVDTSAIAKVAEIAEPVPVAKVVVSAAKKVEGVEKKCECFKSQLHYLKWVPKCKGLAHCPRAKKDKIVSDIKVAAVADVQLEPVQLLNLSNAEEEEITGNTKSAAQVFMEEKVKQTNACLRMKAKLALLEKEVKLGHQVLAQTETLLKSKEALSRRKVRVTFIKCHKFWRGNIIAMHKSFVDEQVDAAKARLGLRRFQFDISAMVDIINNLAPEGRYNSAKPPPSSTSTPRPRFQTFAPRRSPPSPRRTRSLAIPAPPIIIPVLDDKSSAWYRGDLCIVSHGDTITEDLCYDNPTQLKHPDDEYLWDDYFDFMSYEEEAEAADAECDFICEDCDFGDADVVYYCAEGGDGDFADGDDYDEVIFAEDDSARSYSD